MTVNLPVLAAGYLMSLAVFWAFGYLVRIGERGRTLLAMYSLPATAGFVLTLKARQVILE
jgi:hypothetical protein